MSSLVVSNLLVVATVYSWLLGTFAAVGDVHGADPQGLALAQSRLELMQPLAGLVCPLIGAKLATISVRIPYLLAAAAYSVQTLVVLGLPETLAKAGRKAWSWSAASPLSVLQLFTRGTRLRVLALMTLLNELSAGHSRQWMAITQTQRDDCSAGRRCSAASTTALLGPPLKDTLTSISPDPIKPVRKL